MERPAAITAAALFTLSGGNSGAPPARHRRPGARNLEQTQKRRVILAEVVAVGEARKVKTNDRVLIMTISSSPPALGIPTSGHDEWEKLAPALKSLKTRLSYATDPFSVRIRGKNSRRSGSQGGDEIVVIGGGPTGVVWRCDRGNPRYTLAKNFRHIDPSQARVILIEARRACRRVTAGPVRERAKTIARTWRGSAHERTRDEHYRGRCASGRRIYSVPRENLGGWQCCVVRRENAHRSG